jgi:hypothetical protein
MTAVERSARPLPMTVDEITRDWLAAALRTRAPEAGLRGFQIVDINNGTCTKIRLQLDLDEAARRAGIPERVILKGGFETHSRQMHYMHDYEARSYTDVLPTLKLPSPKCYFAEYVAEQKQGIVIMEDLTTRDVTFCHPLQPQTPKQVARRLTNLARFHAQTWGSAEFAPGGRWGWLKLMIPEGGGHLAQFLKPEIWQRYVDMPRGRAASVYFQSLEWMIDAFNRIAMLASRLPHAVLHGDTHLGNLYVEADGTPGFFDSQPHRWPAMEEVTYHIACALDPIDRRRAEKDLLRLYVEELRRHGVDAPSLDETLKHYAVFLPFGFCIFMINESFFQPEAINTAYTSRFSAAMIDNDTIGVLRTIR